MLKPVKRVKKPYSSPIITMYGTVQELTKIKWGVGATTARRSPKTAAVSLVVRPRLRNRIHVRATRTPPYELFKPLARSEESSRSPKCVSGRVILTTWTASFE